MSDSPQTPETPADPRQRRLKEYEDPHYHDEDEVLPSDDVSERDLVPRRGESLCGVRFLAVRITRTKSLSGKVRRRVSNVPDSLQEHFFPMYRPRRLASAVCALPPGRHPLTPGLLQCV